MVATLCLRELALGKSHSQCTRCTGLVTTGGLLALLHVNHDTAITLGFSPFSTKKGLRSPGLQQNFGAESETTPSKVSRGVCVSASQRQRCGRAEGRPGLWVSLFQGRTPSFTG